MATRASLDEAWCILRTANRDTLRVANALTAMGFEAWTPIEERRIRVPRMNVKRDVRLPMMPSYVFARASHLFDLIAIANDPTRQEGFSVFHYFDRIPLIADSELANMRRIEARRTQPKKADKAFPLGSSVRVGAGSFGGMIGKVEASDRGHTLVCFNSRYVVKISTFLLSEDAAYQFQPETGTAALAA